MYVTLDMERLRNPYSGLGQFCWHLGKALMDLPKDAFHFEWLVPKHLENEWNGRGLRVWNKWWPMSTQTDVWHCTHQDSKLWPSDQRTPVLMTIHDLNFLEREDYSPTKKQRKLSRLQQRITRCKGLAYISHFVRDWTHAHLKIPQHTIERVIYNGNNLAPGAAQSARPSWATWQPFVFSIGLHPKKNYDALLPLLAQLPDLRWVIAGAGGQAYKKTLELAAAEAKVADRLIFTEAVRESEKQWLFAHCEALWFPSKAEGFGLPVVEAMSLGKPVFLSRSTSLPEIGGTAAFYFDNFSKENLYKTYLNGMETYNKNPQISHQIRAWADQFSWKNAAQAYGDFYQTLSNNQPCNA